MGGFQSLVAVVQGQRRMVSGWEASQVDSSGRVVTRHAPALDTAEATKAGCSKPSESSHL